MSASFVPIYFEIERELRALIARGHPHDLLPSEAELCRRFGVSRMTARAAIQPLIHEGLVYRVRGRGTFIAAHPLDRQLVHLRSFSEDARVRGLAPRSRLLEGAVRRGSEEENDALSQEASADVVSILRIRLADEIPMAMDKAILRADCAQVLNDDLENGSLYRSLLAIDVVPTNGSSVVSARIVDAFDAQQLDLRRGSALLVERRLIYDQHGTPLEYTESRYVPDRFVLRLNFDVERSSTG